MPSRNACMEGHDLMPGFTGLSLLSCHGLPNCLIQHGLSQSPGGIFLCTGQSAYAARELEWAMEFCEPD